MTGEKETHPETLTKSRSFTLKDQKEEKYPKTFHKETTKKLQAFSHFLVFFKLHSIFGLLANPPRSSTFIEFSMLQREIINQVSKTGSEKKPADYVN